MVRFELAGRRRVGARGRGCGAGSRGWGPGGGRAVEKVTRVSRRSVLEMRMDWEVRMMRTSESERLADVDLAGHMRLGGWVTT